MTPHIKNTNQKSKADKCEHKVAYLSCLLEKADQHLTDVMMVLRDRDSLQYKPPIRTWVLAHTCVLHAFR